VRSTVACFFCVVALPGLCLSFIEGEASLTLCSTVYSPQLRCNVQMYIQHASCPIIINANVRLLEEWYYTAASDSVTYNRLMAAVGNNPVAA
jgi:hypothetical protein